MNLIQKKKKNKQKNKLKDKGKGVEFESNQKDQVNFKIYDIKTRLANNCNTHIDKYLKK